MKRIQLTLKLIDPLVISQSSATEGLHQTLDYIPGSNLLGAMAAKHYQDLDNAETIFHSGQVRFGNAYPVIDNQLTQPVPMSLHYTKGQPERAVTNLLTGNIEGQPKQHRKGYLTPDLQLIKPKKDLHLRTAIEAGKGTAAENQLYTYQSIKAGMTYQAHIDCDSEQLANTVSSLLKTGQTLRFGRSKTAHYGRSELKKIEVIDLASPELYKNNEQIILWLASDLIAYDYETGQPTLMPTLKDLGLAESGDLIASKSFIRTRSYSPYNGFRRSYDMQQQVISQGSILVYPKVEINTEQLKQGLGVYTETGHGQVVNVDEKWQAVFQQPFTLNEPEKDKPKDKPVQSVLANMLKSRYAVLENKEALQEPVNKALKELIKLYQSIRSYNGTSVGVEVGPSSTQWGRIRTLTEKQTFDNKQKLISALEDILKEGDEAWTTADNQNSFKSFLRKTIYDFKDKKNIGVFVRMLARESSHSQQIAAARKGDK